MGKTLEECYEILGLEYGATEGNLFEKFDDLPVGFVREFLPYWNFHTFSLSSATFQSNSYNCDAILVYSVLSELLKFIK